MLRTARKGDGSEDYDVQRVRDGGGERCEGYRFADGERGECHQNFLSAAGTYRRGYVPGRCSGELDPFPHAARGESPMDRTLQCLHRTHHSVVTVERYALGVGDLRLRAVPGAPAVDYGARYPATDALWWGCSPDHA